MKNLKIHHSYVLFVCLTIVVGVHHLPDIAWAKEAYVLTTVAGSSATYAGEEVVREAYRRIGHNIVVQRIDGKKALEQSNQGLVDAELARIDGISRVYQNLIQVPIPINYYQGVAFSKKYNFPIKGWSSLKPYHIGIVKGIIFAKQGTQGMNVTVADTYAQLIDLLKNSKIDVAVMPRINGLVALKNAEADGIKEMEGVLETLFTYHYVNIKNKSLVPKLEKVLKDMLLKGTTREIQAKVYQKLLSGDPSP